MIDAVAPIMSSQPVTAQPSGAITADDFNFDALIDTINPLQHIPVVSTIYRELTGDKMGAPASIAGGALYGGVFGFFSALGNEFLKAVTGHDIGETVLSLLQGDGDSTDGTTAVASSSDPYRANRATQAYQTAQALTNPG
jgi:hypothetical protein